MYSRDTLKKYVSTMKASIKKYRTDLQTGEVLKVSFSYGNRKIGKTLNISTAPIITCGNCRECLHECYDIKACMQYENVRNARAINTAILMEDRDEFFKQISDKISRRKVNKYVRFHVAGEILDADYLWRMINIAKNIRKQPYGPTQKCMSSSMHTSNITDSFQKTCTSCSLFGKGYRWKTPTICRRSAQSRRIANR